VFKKESSNGGLRGGNFDGLWCFFGQDFETFGYNGGGFEIKADYEVSWYNMIVMTVVLM
jgi:hypothetical protein